MPNDTTFKSIAEYEGQPVPDEFGTSGEIRFSKETAEKLARDGYFNAK